MTSLSPWRHSPYSHFTDEETEALSSRACLSHSLSEMTQLQKQGAGPHLDVRAPTSPCHRTTWRPCWSPGEGHGPGTTAYSQAGAGRHSACSPWGQVPSEIRAPHLPGWQDQEDPLPGPPRSGRLLPGLGSPRGHQPEAQGPPGPRAPAKPEPLPSLHGVYSFRVICLCLRKRGLSKNLQTVRNEPSSNQHCAEIRHLWTPSPRDTLPAPCTLRSGQTSRDTGSSCGRGHTHTRPGPRRRAGGPRSRGRAGEGWGRAREQSYTSLFFLRHQGSPSADGGGELVGEKQKDSGYPAVTPTGAPGPPATPAPRRPPPPHRPLCPCCWHHGRSLPSLGLGSWRGALPAFAQKGALRTLPQPEGAGHPLGSHPTEHPRDAAHSASQPFCQGRSQRACLCHIHTHTHNTHTYTHTYTQRHIHTTHTYTHNTYTQYTYRDTHTYIHTIHRDIHTHNTHACIHAYNTQVQTDTHTYIHTERDTHNTHTETRIHTTRTYAHTNTQT